MFIEAKNRYYAFDLAPGFWEWLDADAAAGAIGSIEEVSTELLAGADELARWAQTHPAMFASVDQATVANGAHVISRPSSGAFGQCRNQMPWACDAVPEGTVEAEFGRTIQPGWTMLAAKADPVAGVTGTAQIQVLFEAPAGTDVSGWLSLADTTDHFATSAPAPQLADLGVTSIDGGSSGFMKVYTGHRDGRVYVWAYKRL
ncbi:DUF4411 family protein [Curtobacterium flaccumfaciens]|nr:DUF4411 family protein [Curtobacterium flaccumfaciens]